MGKDQTTAADHPTTNELASVFDPEAPHPPAYLTLGTTPHAFENPPNPGDTMTLVVKVRCKGFGGDLNADGKFIHKRKMTIMSAWVQGTTPPPDPEDKQPAMIDEKGDVTADAATITDSAPPAPEPDEDEIPATEDDADGIAHLAAVIDGNPQFSDAAVKASARVRDKAKADAAKIADAVKGDADE